MLSSSTHLSLPLLLCSCSNATTESDFPEPLLFTLAFFVYTHFPHSLCLVKHGTQAASSIRIISAAASPPFDLQKTRRPKNGHPEKSGHLIFERRLPLSFQSLSAPSHINTHTSHTLSHVFLSSNSSCPGNVKHSILTDITTHTAKGLQEVKGMRDGD